MQNCSPDADSRTLREFSAHLRVLLQETDSAKPITSVGLNCDAEFAERRNRFGHQAFAAGLVDRRLGTVGDDDGHSSLPRSDGGRQPRRASANNKHIHLCFAGDHS